MSICVHSLAQEKSDFEIEMIDGVVRVFRGPGREQEAFPLPGNSFDFFSDMHWCGTAALRIMLSRIDPLETSSVDACSLYQAICMLCVSDLEPCCPLSAASWLGNSYRSAHPMPHSCIHAWSSSHAGSLPFACVTPLTARPCSLPMEHACLGPLTRPPVHARAHAGCCASAPWAPARACATTG